MSHGSTSSYVSSVRTFAAYLKAAGIELLNVDKEILRNYVGHIQARGLTFKTLSYNFAVLFAFYEMLVFEGDIPANPVLGVRKRYMRRYKNGEGMFKEGRKLISVEEMSMLVRSIRPVRDRAVVILLAKTGVRRGEFVTMDLEDLNLDKCSVKLKPTAKRTNRLVFFDEEAKLCLIEWLKEREKVAKPESKALFLSDRGNRLDRDKVLQTVVMHATALGLNDPNSERLEDKFTPHCCRHWFTTHLMRSGMPREHVQELRGDVRNDAVDIYYHIDPEELRKSYLTHMPKLGL
jgi:integrase/recombinase XerD